MPFPQEHACRINNPDKYDRFARKNCDRKVDGKCIDVIYGIAEGKSEVQSLRFDKKIWDAGAARAYCKEQKGSFEAASEGRSMMRRMYTKSAGGNYQAMDVSHDDLVTWFKAHIDEDGVVTEDVMLDWDVEIKTDDGEEVPVFVLSDYSLDRDMERIDPDGWDFKAYKQNPIILWSHDWSRPAIGKMSKLRKSEGKIIGRPEFDDRETDEFAWMIGEKVRKGIISSGSVGIRSLKIEIVNDPKELARLIHRQTELVEFSIVNIPSNPNAGAQRGIIRDAEDDIDYTRSVGPHYSVELFKDMRESSAIPECETSDLDYLFANGDTTQTPIEVIFDGSETGH